MVQSASYTRQEHVALFSVSCNNRWYRREPATPWMVVALAVFVVGVELLYFEREVIERELSEMEDNVESRR